MLSNYFELVGTVNFIDFKYLENGKAVLTMILGKQNYKDRTQFDSFPVSCYGELAEDIYNRIKKKNKVGIKGRIGKNTYVDKEGKKVDKYVLHINECDVVEYNEKEKTYVVAENKALEDEIDVENELGF